MRIYAVCLHHPCAAVVGRMPWQSVCFRVGACFTGPSLVRKQIQRDMVLIMMKIVIHCLRKGRARTQTPARLQAAGQRSRATISVESWPSPVQ